MEVADPEAACKDDIFLGAFKSTAAGLSTSVSADDVEVACTVLSRRLSSDSRRLAGSIELAYRIPLSSADAAAKLVTAIVDMPAEALTKAINEALKDTGYTVTVTEKSVPTTIVVTLTSTTTEDLRGENKPSDSHARGPAVLGPAVMAAVVAATLRFSQ